MTFWFETYITEEDGTTRTVGTYPFYEDALRAVMAEPDRLLRIDRWVEDSRGHAEPDPTFAPPIDPAIPWMAKQLVDAIEANIEPEVDEHGNGCPFVRLQYIGEEYYSLREVFYGKE